MRNPFMPYLNHFCTSVETDRLIIALVIHDPDNINARFTTCNISKLKLLSVAEPTGLSQLIANPEVLSVRQYFDTG